MFWHNIFLDRLLELGMIAPHFGTNFTIFVNEALLELGVATKGHRFTPKALLLLVGSKGELSIIC